MPLLETRKKQKSFIHLGRAGFGTAGSEKKIFLAPFFLKKRRPLSCFQACRRDA
jgi:hypothetical protein